MKQFEDVVAQDPLRLQRYDDGRTRLSRFVYILLAATGLLFAASTAFYILGSVSDLGSAPHTF